MSVVIRKRYKRLAVIVGSFAVLFFVIHRALYFAPGVLEHYSSYLVYPVLVTQHKIVTPVKDYFAHRKTITQLQEQLAHTQAERDTVLAQNIELQGMISFAQDTKELVEFKQRYNFSQALLAQVLVKNFSEQSHFFFN